MEMTVSESIERVETKDEYDEWKFTLVQFRPLSERDPISGLVPYDIQACLVLRRHVSIDLHRHGSWYDALYLVQLSA